MTVLYEMLHIVLLGIAGGVGFGLFICIAALFGLGGIFACAKLWSRVEAMTKNQKECGK